MTVSATSDVVASIRALTGYVEATVPILDLKSDIIAAIKDEGIEASAVTIASAEDGGLARSSIPHEIAIPALYIVVKFADDLTAEVRTRLIARISDIVMGSRREGDPVAKKVEEVILYDAREDPIKVIERKRIKS